MEVGGIKSQDPCHVFCGWEVGDRNYGPLKILKLAFSTLLLSTVNGTIKENEEGC